MTVPEGKFCPVCGTKMVKFLNPFRLRCPRENTHPTIEKQIRVQDSHRGRKIPGNAKNAAKARAAKKRKKRGK